MSETKTCTNCGETYAMIGTGLCYHVCVPPIHYKKQLDEARAELAGARAEHLAHLLQWSKDAADRDDLRAKIEEHNARITLGTQHMVIPLPPATKDQP